MLESVKNIHHNLERILEITSMDYARLSKIVRKDISSPCDFSSLDLHVVDEFLIFLNLSISHLVNGNFCEDTLELQAKGSNEAIPSIYKKSNGTKVKSVLSPLSLVPEVDQRNFLRQNQIGEKFLKDIENEVSYEMYLDAALFAKKYTLLDNFKTVGFVNAKSFFGERKQDNIGRAEFMKRLEHLILNTDMIEKNMNYKIISKSNNKMTVMSTPKEHVLEIASRRKFEGCDFADTITGFLQGYSYINNTKTFVDNTLCSISKSAFEVTCV